MQKKYSKLIVNTSLLAIGSFASKLLGMFLTPLYTSILTTSDYGVADLISTTTFLLFPFLSLAISEAIMRFALDKNCDKRSVYTIGITIVLCGFLILVCAIPIIKVTTIGQYTALFIAYYLMHCLYTITGYFVKGLGQVRIYAMAGLMSSAVIITGNILFLVVFKWGIKGYLFASTLGHAFAALYMFVAAGLHKYVIGPWSVEKSLFKEMIRYSIPIIPNSISWWIANSSDKYMLNYYAGVAQVGVYSVSYKIPTILMTVMGFFISAWQLSAAEEFGKKNTEQFFSDVYDKCFAVNCMLATMLIATAKITGRFLYAADFFPAWEYVPVLVMANVFNGLASFMGSVYTSAKKTKMLSLSTMIGAGVNILINAVLIPEYGALGAAIATMVSYFVIWAVRMLDTRRILRFDVNMKRDIILMVLLLVQVLLMGMDLVVAHLCAAVIMLAVLLYFRSLVFEAVKKGYRMLTKKSIHK